MTYNNDQFTEVPFLKQKQSSSLRSNVPELRDFEQKLRNIYIGNNQVCQMKEKEYKKLQDEIYRKREIKILQAEQNRDAEKKKREIDELEKNKLIYGKELLIQVDHKQKQKSCLKDQIKNEMEANEKIQNSILEEVERQKLERISKVADQQYEMKIFNTAKNIHIKKNHILQLYESERIECERIEQEERLHNREEEDKRKAQLKNSIRSQISSNILAQKIAQQERLQLIQEMQEFEYNKSQSRNHTEEGAQKNLVKESMRKILKLQLDSNMLREKKLKEDEDKYRRQLSLEQETLERDDNKKVIDHERKQAEYAAALKKQIKDDLERRKRQQISTRESDNYVKQYNENIERQIQEEKQRILDEYNSKIHRMCNENFN